MQITGRFRQWQRDAPRNRRVRRITVLSLLGLAAILAGIARGLLAPHPVPLPAGYGVAVGFARGTAADLDRLGPVWYYDYRFDTPDWPGHTHVLLLNAGGTRTDASIGAAVRAQPGHWWILGNEPNDPQQDNLNPTAYARWFVRTAALVRAADPTASIMTAGIADADAAWAQQFVAAAVALSGAPPDADAWNIHDYLLDTPNQYDVVLFERRIAHFHDWLVSAGQGARPLVLGEWGVLYGGGCCSRPLDPESRGTAYLDETATWIESSGLLAAWAWFTLDSGATRFNGDLLRPTVPPALSGFGQHYRDHVQRYRPAKP